MRKSVDSHSESSKIKRKSFGKILANLIQKYRLIGVPVAALLSLPNLFLPGELSGKTPLQQRTSTSIQQRGRQTKENISALNITFEPPSDSSENRPEDDEPSLEPSPRTAAIQPAPEPQPQPEPLRRTPAFQDHLESIRSGKVPLHDLYLLFNRIEDIHEQTPIRASDLGDLVKAVADRYVEEHPEEFENGDIPYRKVQRIVQDLANGLVRVDIEDSSQWGAFKTMGQTAKESWSEEPQDLLNSHLLRETQHQIEDSAYQALNKAIEDLRLATETPRLQQHIPENKRIAQEALNRVINLFSDDSSHQERFRALQEEITSS